MQRSKLFVSGFVLLVVLAFAAVAFAHTSGFTIDRRATLSPGKTMLTVSGTVTCPSDHIAFGISVTAFQGNGLIRNTGFGSTPSFFCTGNLQTWQVIVGPDVGPLPGGDPGGVWRPGQVSVKATVRTCPGEIDPWGGFLCYEWPESVDTIDATVRASK